jgi:Kef-type K+ transport system membrane component KefB
MVSRGEVALIVANKGAAVGLIREEYFAPIIIVVLVTTLITPILLKIAYKEKSKNISSVIVHQT